MRLHRLWIVALLLALGVLFAAAALARSQKTSGVHSYLLVTGNTAGLFRVEIVRGGQVKVVASSKDDFWGSAFWAADRSMTAWSGVSGLFIARADGSAKRQLSGYGSPYAWAPQGHRLIAGTGKGVKVIDAATGRSRYVKPQVQGGSIRQWLPSGLIAYTRPYGLQDDPLAAFSLVVAGTDGGTARVLDKAIIGKEDSFSFSPDGRHVLVTHMTGGKTGNRYVRSIIDVASGKTRVLNLFTTSTSSTSLVGPSWLPDGRLGFARNDGGRERLMSVAVDGHGLRTLLTLNRGDKLAFVPGSPGSHRPAFTVYSGDRMRIMTVGVDGRNLRTLLTVNQDTLGWQRQWPNGDLTLQLGRELVEIRDEPGARARIVYRIPSSWDIFEFDRS